MKPGDRNTDQTTGGRGTHYFLGPLLNPTRAWDVPARVTIIRGYSDSIVERDETLLVLLLSIKKKKDLIRSGWEDFYLVKGVFMLVLKNKVGFQVILEFSIS